MIYSPLILVVIIFILISQLLQQDELRKHFEKQLKEQIKMQANTLLSGGKEVKESKTERSGSSKADKPAGEKQKKQPDTVRTLLEKNRSQSKLAQALLGKFYKVKSYFCAVLEISFL